MVDVHSKKIRSKNMAAIKGADTKPEIWLRRRLHALGYRYRLHPKNLPGKPDIVLPKYSAVIFINGCFWHMHGCHLGQLPKSRKKWWSDKLGKNVLRDFSNHDKLRELGWRVAVVWECAISGKTRQNEGDLIGEINRWMGAEEPFLELSGGLNEE